MGGTLMASQTISKAASPWERMRERVAETGEIALPAVSSIHLAEDGQASIVLIAPHLVPGVDEVFVQNEGLPPADQVTLDGLLEVLRTIVADRVGRLASVWHAEDLDYV